MSLITIRTENGFESTVFVAHGPGNDMVVGGEEALRLQKAADIEAGVSPTDSPVEGLGDIALGSNVQVVATYGTLQQYDTAHHIN